MNKVIESSREVLMVLKEMVLKETFCTPERLM